MKSSIGTRAEGISRSDEISGGLRYRKSLWKPSF